MSETPTDGSAAPPVLGVPPACVTETVDGWKLELPGAVPPWISGRAPGVMAGMGLVAAVSIFGIEAGLTPFCGGPLVALLVWWMCTLAYPRLTTRVLEIGAAGVRLDGELILLKEHGDVRHEMEGHVFTPPRGRPIHSRAPKLILGERAFLVQLEHRDLEWVVAAIRSVREHSPTRQEREAASEALRSVRGRPKQRE